MSNGSILILVVWVISLLSILAAGLGSQGVSALSLTDRLSQQLQASYVASAAAQRAFAVIDGDQTSSYDGMTDEWANRAGLFESQPFDGGQFTISYQSAGQSSSTIFGLIDEERKLNINLMPPDVLQAFFELQGGLKEDAARDLSQAIIDWRDADHEKQPYGAESFYYLGRSPSYECKDAPFESVEELLLVRGMTPDLFAQVSPWLTVYGSGQVNLNTAGEPVLRALGLSHEAVNAIVFYRAGEDNAQGGADDRAFTSVPEALSSLDLQLSNADKAVLGKLSGKHLLTVQAQAFSMSIDAQTDGGGLAHVSCVMDRDGNVLSWTEQ